MAAVPSATNHYDKKDRFQDKTEVVQYSKCNSWDNGITGQFGVEHISYLWNEAHFLSLILHKLSGVLIGY